jgi:hypothetical protein
MLSALVGWTESEKMRSYKGEHCLLLATLIFFENLATFTETRLFEQDYAKCWDLTKCWNWRIRYSKDFCAKLVEFAVLSDV